MSSFQFQSPVKAVAGRYYVHVDAFPLLSRDFLSKLVLAETLAQVDRTQHFNVARFENSSDRVSLLNYPGFFEEAFLLYMKVGTST
jgi:hypothetical protein